ncbi:type III secretion system translocon subunit SctE [Terasakiella pusilla]|uniref:type III secretion system translocon subunit SctE n=1 Tax=Terasakiella pusilla TaxID=64973 RepID=UPI003AA96117
MSGINVNSGGGVNPNLTTQSLDETQSVERAQGPKGSVTQAQVATTMPGGAGASGSLPKLAEPGMTGDQAALLLLEIRNKLSEETINTSKESIEADKSKKEDQHAEAIKKLEEAAKSAEKAEKAGVFGKVFGWVATAALAIAGAALIATGGGAVAGGIMLAMAVDSALRMSGAYEALGNAVGGDVGEVMKGGVVGGLTTGIAKGLEALGMDETAANIVAGIAVTVVIVAVTWGAGSGGAAVNATTQAAAQATQAAAKAAQVAGTIAKASSMVSAASTIGGSVSGMAKASYEKDATDSRAEHLKLQAMIAKMQSQMEEETDRIKKVVEELEESVSTVMDILSSQDSSTGQLVGQMNKA